MSKACQVLAEETKLADFDESTFRQLDQLHPRGPDVKVESKWALVNWLRGYCVRGGSAAKQGDLCTNHIGGGRKLGFLKRRTGDNPGPLRRDRAWAWANTAAVGQAMQTVAALPAPVFREERSRHRAGNPV